MASRFKIGRVRHRSYGLLAIPVGRIMSLRPRACSIPGHRCQHLRLRGLGPSTRYGVGSGVGRTHVAASAVPPDEMTPGGSLGSHAAFDVIEDDEVGCASGFGGGTPLIDVMLIVVEAVQM